MTTIIITGVIGIIIGFGVAILTFSLLKINADPTLVEENIRLRNENSILISVKHKLMRELEQEKKERRFVDDVSSGRHITVDCTPRIMENENG